MLVLQSSLSQAAVLLAEFQWDTWLLPLIWLSVMVMSLVIESQTTDLVSIWFAPGAFVAMILACFNVNIYIQLLTFSIMSILGLVLAFTVVRPAMKKRITVLKTNAEAMSEKTAVVEEDIHNAMSTGVVKINGQLWTARMEDPDLTVAKGEWVVIVRVEGSKVICRPAK